MAITDETRHHLFQRFEALWSREEAVMMMEHLPPVDWIHLARRDDLERMQVTLRTEVADLGTALRAEMAHQAELLRWEMTAGLATLRAEVATQTATVRAEMAALSTDVAEFRSQLTTDVAELRSQLGTDVAELRSDLRTGLAQNELYVTRLFTDFREEIRLDQRTTSRQITLALVVALISMVVATAGLG